MKVQHAVRGVTSDTRPSVLAIDNDLLLRAIRHTQFEGDYRRYAEEIAAEYSRLLEERVAPESESELREAFGK